MATISGPGRPDAFAIAGQPGSDPLGGVRDNRDGSYSVDLCWDPESSAPPGVIVDSTGTLARWDTTSGSRGL